MYTEAPLSPLSLAPPPSLRPPSTFSPISPKYDGDGAGEWTWEWDGWGDAGDLLAGASRPVHIDASADGDRDGESEEDLEGSGVGGIGSEDAAHVAAWRRHCAGLECVRLVSGAWWMREEE